MVLSPHQKHNKAKYLSNNGAIGPEITALGRPSNARFQKYRIMASIQARIEHSMRKWQWQACSRNEI